MSLFRGNPFTLALKILVPVAIVVWVLHGVDFRAIGATLRKIPPLLFLLAVGVQIVYQMLQALRWKLLIGRGDLRYKDYLGFVSLGYVFAIFAPSMLISDSANAWLLGKRNQGVVQSVSAMFVGRLLGMGALVVYFAFVLRSHLWVFSRVPWQSRHSAYVFLALPVIAVLLFLWVRWRGATWRGKWRDRGVKVWHEVLEVLGRPGALAAGLALSLAMQGLLAVISWIGFAAMDIPVGLSDIMFFSPIIMFLALAPVSIGQIGVREGLAVFLYTLLPGVSKEQMLANLGFGYGLFVVMGALNALFAVRILRLHREGGRLMRHFFPSRSGEVRP